MLQILLLEQSELERFNQFGTNIGANPFPSEVIILFAAKHVKFVVSCEKKE